MHTFMMRETYCIFLGNGRLVKVNHAPPTPLTKMEDRNVNTLITGEGRVWCI